MITTHLWPLLSAIAIAGQPPALSDPDRRVPFVIANEFSAERRLTARDLALGAAVRSPDGTWWLADELGPSLLHVDARGRLLEAPYPLPDPDRGGRWRSPDSPDYEESVGTRFMNALQAHAERHGVRRSPVFSPFHQLVADGDPRTVSPGRLNPFLPAAGSEIFDPAKLAAAGHATLPWTVNDRAEMATLMRRGVAGLISDDPSTLRAAVAAFDADGDGRAGEWLDADGLIDRRRFDAQGHRGARALRPENTLPAFEAALDHLMTTLETDVAISRDGIAMLSHEPVLSNAMARRRDGRPIDRERPLHGFSATELQRSYVFDRLQPHFFAQRRDPALSPVAVAFARDRALGHPYVMPTLAQLFAFVRAYEAYYRDGAGRSHPEARRRRLNAARVHFNVETKLTPGLERAGSAPEPRRFVRAIADVVTAEGLAERVQIQSFDYRTLLVAHEEFPALQTVFLTAERVPYGMRPAEAPRQALGPLWEGQVAWPHRFTKLGQPPRAIDRIAGLRLEEDGTRLTLELSAPDGERVFAFDVAGRRFVDARPVEGRR